MKFELYLVSSQVKHPAGREENNLQNRTVEYGTTLQNEPYSIQALYRVFDDKPIPCHPVSIAVDGGRLSVEQYRVDFVPVTQAHDPRNIQPVTHSLRIQTVPGSCPFGLSLLFKGHLRSPFHP